MKCKKYCLVVIGILTFLAVLCGFSGCMKLKWEEAYDNFNDETDKYQRIKGVINSIKSYDVESNSYVFKLTVDAEDYELNYKTDDCYPDGSAKWETYLRYYNTFEFRLVPENGIIVNENGFFDNVCEGDEVFITTHTYYGWTGWKFPVLSLQVGDKVYLEFETGQENWLNYMEAHI